MSGKHLYGQMWINVHLFFKPEIKPDLQVLFLFHFISQRQKRRADVNEAERETKEESRVVVSLTCGEVARRSQTVKLEGTKKKKKMDWMEGRQRESSDAPQSCCGLLK